MCRVQISSGCSKLSARKLVQCSLLLREILFALIDIRLDGITARFPASWAHFTMFVSELEG
ncbi:rCG28967, partial [Rattus norvegicus]